MQRAIAEPSHLGRKTGGPLNGGNGVNVVDRHEKIAGKWFEVLSKENIIFLF